MGCKLCQALNCHESMENAAVTEIKLRAFHEPLGDVRVVRLQNTDHESAFQYFKVTSHGHVGYAEGSADLGEVKDLCVVVGQHHPESPECSRGNSDSKLRNVPFQICCDVAVPPHGALVVGSGQVGSRESSPYPELFHAAITGIVQMESSQGMETDPSCQGFASM